ncbi:MAG: nucleotide pyrophosphohydrolase [Candidatus Omnitrophica bacterium]|nr:nucleotide pyrophosphohydrolase [Candidatus Omnitrophota bacterium]
MSDSRTTVSELRRIVRRFIEERDWMQFHSPKNIAMSIAIEAAELMEHFQWTFAAKPEEKHLGMDRTKIEDEIADIAVYVLDFCEVMGIDLSGAVRRKMIQNRKKYPAAQVRGKTHKYTYYQALSREKKSEKPGKKKRPSERRSR